jgi:hypothetical protein
MRERAPRSGFGFLLTLIVFAAAAVIVLKSILERIPRP